MPPTAQVTATTTNVTSSGFRKVVPGDIGWGAYGGYAGPYYRGASGMVPSLSQNASEMERIFYVITQTEGGNYTAINMYDVMIISVGAIQWAENSQYSVSTILGKAMEAGAADHVNESLKPAFDLCGEGTTFKRNAKGLWRFFCPELGGEVDTSDKQRKLFLGCSGKEHEWTESAKVRAKTWAACVATVFCHPLAQESQRRYTVDHVGGFFTKQANELLCDGGKLTALPKEVLKGWRGAITALFASFAANNPSIASSMLVSHCNETPHEKFSPSWCIALAQKLTFGPVIKIYPIRYAKLAPLIDKMYGSAFPVSSDALRAWVPQLPEQPASPNPDDEDITPVIISFPSTDPVPVDLLPDSDPPDPTPPETIMVPQPPMIIGGSWLSRLLAMIFNFFGSIFGGAKR